MNDELNEDLLRICCAVDGADYIRLGRFQYSCLWVSAL